VKQAAGTLNKYLPIFSPLKQWFVILLLLITVVATFVPCCADGCADEISTTAAAHEDEHDDKGNCSPLFACSTCAPSVIIHTAEPLVTLQAIDHAQFPFFIARPLSTWHPSLFQPPKVC
jgi:hypothetical protein